MTTSAGLLFSLFGVALIGPLLVYVKFKLAKIDMTFFEFSRRLMRGGGYKNISPREFDDLRGSGHERLKIVDLRDRKTNEATPIPGSIPSPFDEFLKEVVVEKRFEPNDPIVLVCDTGHMSRVAANILVEDEGFTDAYNLAGGTANWTRWQMRTARASRCCSVEKLAACCS